MTLKFAGQWADFDAMETPNSRFTASMEPDPATGVTGGVQTRPIRDRILSDSTRIPRKTAFKGAKTCVSNQIRNRKNPYEYAERRTIGPEGPRWRSGWDRFHKALIIRAITAE
jgi:hypothetical protein